MTVIIADVLGYSNKERRKCENCGTSVQWVYTSGKKLICASCKRREVVGRLGEDSE